MAKGDIETLDQDSQWRTRAQGAAASFDTYATKSVPKTARRNMAKTRGVEHMINKQDGTIAERNSYSNDPRS